MNVEEMAVKLAETESRSKSNTHRIDRLEKSADALNRLATSIEVMATEQGHQTEAIKGVKADLVTLSDKVWDGLVDKVIYGIVGALVTAFVGALVYFLGVAP